MATNLFPFASKTITFGKINKKYNFLYSLFCFVYVSIKKNPLVVIDFLFLYLVIYFFLKKYTFTFIFEKKSSKNMFD